MESVVHEIVNRWKDDSEVAGLVAVHKSSPYSPVIDGFDLLMLVVFADGYAGANLNRSHNHYMCLGYRIVEKRTNISGLKQWILSGENRNAVQWLMQGDIMLDRGDQLKSLRKEMSDFAKLLREQRLFTEFSLFYRKYLLAKQYVQSGHHLDAYCNILEALAHWAHIAVIEEGAQPEVMVWEQVKQYNLGIYKLYEELTLSTETMGQRVKLVLLACEFSVMSKMKQCCALLLRIIQSRQEPWTASELCDHPLLSGLHAETSLMLRKLAERSFIREVMEPQQNVSAAACRELRYTYGSC